MVLSPENPGGSVSGEKVKIVPGTFTIINPSGSYRTIKIRKNENAEFFEGKGWLVYYLRGPDNESDFESCGIVLDSPFKIVIWKKFSSVVSTEFRLSISTAINDLRSAGELFALRSSKCWRCGHKLTVPVSIYRGLGPDCASKIL